MALVRCADECPILHELIGEGYPQPWLSKDLRVLTAHGTAAAQGLAQLTAMIFARAQPKRLGAQTISGAMLAGLASAYVDAINRGAVPTISTAWQVWPLVWQPK